MSNNQELELYKLCCTDENENSIKYVTELGWVTSDEFLVWIPYIWLAEFMEMFTNIFGCGVFDDGSFEAIMRNDGVCIDLTKALDGYDVDFETTFPKNIYKH